MVSFHLPQPPALPYWPHAKEDIVVHQMASVYCPLIGEMSVSLCFLPAAPAEFASALLVSAPDEMAHGPVPLLRNLKSTNQKAGISLNPANRKAENTKTIECRKWQQLLTATTNATTYWEMSTYYQDYIKNIVYVILILFKTLFFQRIQFRFYTPILLSVGTLGDGR